MDSFLTLGIPCRADEPGLGGTLESLFVACQHPELPAGLIVEMVICINGLGKGQKCLPLASVRDFCARHRVLVKEVWLTETEKEGVDSVFLGGTLAPVVDGEDFIVPSPQWGEGQGEGEGDTRRNAECSQREGVPLACTVVLTEEAGKPRAWNAIWRQARGGVVLFCDADVRVEKEAVHHLYARLQRDPHLRLVAAREVPVIQEGGTLWSRMGAIPYRFDFGNVGGRLYLIRKDALPGKMPEDLLLEDAWLTVAVGRRRVAKEPCARVFFLPPATWCDYFAERVRTEGGKMQIRQTHRSLLAEDPIAKYNWSQFWQRISFREYPLMLLALELRGLARVWAWVALTWKDFYSLYRPFSSTKGWVSFPCPEPSRKER